MVLWILPDGHNILGAIFVEPAYQDQGVGAQMWHFVEATYPQAKSWRLATPDWATKNTAYYVKCGFERVAPDALPGTPEGFSVYRKQMPPSGT